MESVCKGVKWSKKISLYCNKVFSAFIPSYPSPGAEIRRRKFFPLKKCVRYFVGGGGGPVTLTGTATLTPTCPPAARIPSFAAMVVTKVFTIKFT